MTGLELLLPLGVVALLALPVVVFFHMRHTNPVVQPVPTLRFWQAASPERPEDKRFRRPPLSILLLLQLLIVGLLAVGLMRPATATAWSWLGIDLRTEPTHLIVIVDGSTSMSATDTADGSRRWDAARAEAMRLLGTPREGDVATVMVLGTRTITMEATDTGGFTEVRERFANLEPPGGRADLTAALSLAGDLLLPRLKDQIIVITDGALIADPGVVAELSAPIEYRQVGGALDGLAGANVGIIGLSARADPTNPDRELLYARIGNFSDQTQTIPVLVLADGNEQHQESVTIDGNGGVSELQWALPPGVSRVEVIIEVRDALAVDDRASLILRQDADLALNILLVSDVPGALRRALEVLPGARVQVEAGDSPLARSPGAGFDLIVYDGVAPPETVPDAALLLVRPPADGGPFLTRGEMSAPTVRSVAADDPLLRGVDLGGLHFAPTTVFELAGDQTMVIGAEAGPLLFRGTLGGQPMVTIAFDLDASNLTQRVAFPILIANIATALVPSPLPPSVPLGDPLRYRPSHDTITVQVVAPNGETTDLAVSVDGTIPSDASSDAAGQRLNAVVFSDTGQTGVYQVRELTEDDQELGVGRFVVNAGHPTESDLRVNTNLPTVFAAAGVIGADAIGPVLADLWPILVAAALLALGVEWLLTNSPRRRRRRHVIGAPSPVTARGHNDG